jgi:uncharacterized protein YvpB
MIKKKLREVVYYLKSLKKFRLTSRNKKRIAVLGVLAAVIFSLIGISVCVSVSNIKKEETEAPVQETAHQRPEKYMIPNVKVIAMDDLKAGCETYACTMLMNTIGFDLDEHTFADNYLDCHYVFLDEDGLTGTGPDMYSAFAGTAYAGWGVYAPSMAKSMNKYLADQKSSLKAYAMENVELEDLIDQYVVKGIPVMIWATTYMQEPYVYHTWTVNYVDENAKTKIE